MSLPLAAEALEQSTKNKKQIADDLEDKANDLIDHAIADAIRDAVSKGKFDIEFETTEDRANIGVVVRLLQKAGYHAGWAYGTPVDSSFSSPRKIRLDIHWATVNQNVLTRGRTSPGIMV